MPSLVCIAVPHVPIDTCHAIIENRPMGGERSSMIKYTKNMEVSSHIKSRTTRNIVRAKKRAGSSVKYGFSVQIVDVGRDWNDANGDRDHTAR
jgi:hypothetical protein